MIKATLNYNPYILETSASFNDKKPRINSEIEKYKNGSNTVVTPTPGKKTNSLTNKGISLGDGWDNLI